MAKKRSTQVREFLAALEPNEFGEVSMSVAKRDWCVESLKDINAQDEQGDKSTRKPRKKAAKKARVR